MPEPPVELAAPIYECARITGEFWLRSGAVSEEYFDKYLFESDPHLLREIAEGLVGLLPARTRPVGAGRTLPPRALIYARCSP